MVELYVKSVYKVIQRIDRYADEHYTSRSGAITMLIVEATKEPKQKK